MTEALALILSTIISAAVAYYVAERSARSAAKVARAEIRNTAKATKDSLEVQIKTSDAQIRASVLAGNRQAWINTLREEMSDLGAAVLYTRFECMKSVEAGKSAFDLNSNRLYNRRTKIGLLINPNEEDHQKLVEMIDDLLRYVSGEQEINTGTENQLFWWVQEFTKLSQTILKREWIRVKNLE